MTLIYLPEPAWGLTKSFLFPPEVRFPDPVWERIKVFAVDFCPRCGGECVLPGAIPCWRRDLWLRQLQMRRRKFVSPRRYRRKWYEQRGTIPVSPPGSGQS